MSVFFVCETCTPFVSGNADTDDYRAYNGDSAADTLESSIESMGMVTLTAEYDNGGYWDCYACNETTIGNGSIFSTD